MNTRRALPVVALLASAALLAACSSSDASPETAATTDSTSAAAGSSAVASTAAVPAAADTSGTIQAYATDVFMAPDEVDGFESKFPDYSIKILPETSTSSAPQVINQNPGNYDVAWLDSASGPQMAEQGGLGTFDAAAIPNLKNVDLSTWVSADAQARFPKDSCIPTDILKEGFVYNSAVIKEPLTSWADFFRVAQEYKGKVLYTSSARDAFAAAQLALGIDVNTEDPDELAKAQALLEEFKPTVLAFSNVDTNKAFADGSAVMAFNYDGYAGGLLAQSDDYTWVTPTDGAPTFVMMYCLLKDGADVQNGVQEWFNHLLDPSVAVKHTETTGFSSPLAATVYPLLSADKKEIETSPRYEPAANPAVLGPISAETNALISNMWQKVISG